MKLKRTLALLLAATSLVAMVGCGGSGTSETGSGSQGGSSVSGPQADGSNAGDGEVKSVEGMTVTFIPSSSIWSRIG